MASKKKNPTFEIPDTVRRAGQSGWVYRTDGEGTPHKRVAGRAGATNPRPTATPKPSKAAASRPAVEAAVAMTAPVPVAAPAVNVETPAAPPAHGLLGFGLHLAAVPFVVPLYVTAAISRRLGLTE